MAKICVMLARSGLVYAAAYCFCACLWQLIQGSYACVPMFAGFAAAYVGLYEIRDF